MAWTFPKTAPPPPKISVNNTTPPQAVSIGKTIPSTVIPFESIVKTSFTPTQQQLTVLQAMEAQKAAEARNDPVYFGTGKTDVITSQEVRELAAQGMTVPSGTTVYSTQDSLNAALEKVQEQQRQTEAFKNRTTQEIYENFIAKISEQERTQDTGTNLNAYLEERGFDPNKPETIPYNIISSPTKLDTYEKSVEAGLAPSIAALRHDQENTYTNFSGSAINYAGSDMVVHEIDPQRQIAINEGRYTQVTAPSKVTLPVDLSPTINLNKPVGISQQDTNFSNPLKHENIPQPVKNKNTTSALLALAGVLLLS
jgi:hypothetical protein